MRNELEKKRLKVFIKPSETELKARLSAEEFAVTQESATEPPFRNQFWNHRDDGIYVDIVSGEVLFSSLDKFDSGCGWPSFMRPLTNDCLSNHVDKQFGMVRTEVRSKLGNSHLGHLFEDGPKPLGLRYCINSAALRFISKERLTEEGYGDWTKIFSKE